MNLEEALPLASENGESGIPVRNLWYMLVYVWDLIHLKDRWASDVETSPTLDSLLATLLANLIHARLRKGLGREYQTDAAEIAGVRGRVDFNESLKRLSFPHGRAFCRFQRFSANVPKNQIIRTTLARLVQIGDFGCGGKQRTALIARLRQLVRELESIDLVEVSTDFIRREQLKRHDMDYAILLAICFLLRQRQMPTDQSGAFGSPGLDRNAMTLHLIYERFIAKFYAHHLDGWSVAPQQKLTWPTEEKSEHLPVMYADLVLQHDVSGHLIVLDTKFTAHSLVTGRWGKQTFDQDHLFQIYAYLKSQEHHSEHHRSATGILLYPAVKQTLTESITVQGHSIRWITIDLAKPWQQIHDDLLAIPASLASQPHT